jgi:hypothetical protein
MGIFSIGCVTAMAIVAADRTSALAPVPPDHIFLVAVRGEPWRFPCIDFKD